jgi:moderate conductance mechanosensitive channel
MNQLISHFGTFLREKWPDLLWVVGLILLGRFGLKVLCERIVKAADDGDDTRQSGREKRAKSLSDLIRAAGNALIGAFALVSMLRLFGIDSIPFIAGASVIGIWAGIGLQTIIKDFIAGVFIFAENQYAVGDKVKIGESEGIVHKMSLRSTVLLDDGGNLVFIPNSAITAVTNYSLGADMKGKEPSPKKAAASDTAPEKAAPRPDAPVAPVSAEAPASDAPP